MTSSGAVLAVGGVPATLYGAYVAAYADSERWGATHSLQAGWWVTRMVTRTAGG